MILHNVKQYYNFAEADLYCIKIMENLEPVQNQKNFENPYPNIVILVLVHCFVLAPCSGHINELDARVHDHQLFIAKPNMSRHVKKLEPVQNQKRSGDVW